MRFLTRILCLVFIVGFFTISNGQKTGRRGALKMVRLTEANDGKTLTISTGQYFTLSLGSQSGGGYRFDKAHYNKSIVREEEHTEQAPAPNAALGHPGQDLWRFTTLKKGRTILKITVSRPWTSKDAKTIFSCPVIVK